MTAPAPHYYHIGILMNANAGIDAKEVESAIEKIVSDWYRYTTNCYLVWTTADATMIAGSLMTVPKIVDAAQSAVPQVPVPINWPE